MQIIEGKVQWIDIIHPKKEDIEYLKTVHDFHPLILDELLHFSIRAKVESYSSYFYCTYHFPLYDAIRRTSRRGEIDFLVTKHAVITVHYEDLEPLHNFAKHLTEQPQTKEQILSNGGFIMYYILQEIHHLATRELRHIEQNVTTITQDLFQHREYQMLRRISYVKRDILDYGVIAKPQQLLLHSLRDIGLEFWGTTMKAYLADLIGEHLKITQQLENFRETTESCEETNSQLLNAKTNGVMQRFTILAFLTFPLMLYTSIFSINNIAAILPSVFEFFIGFALVFIATIITIWIFHRRGLFQDYEE